ncbi:glycyl-radical enzyme activating protein [Acetobacterium carbinolicum]|uniref:glycyl-radical enzyme activating protein n=1 Tax=Acetobacterium carbinolicum TaxID=52690 RepID=UPI0039BFD794
MANNRIGKIINIQRFTIHDGPGIRTEIFLKGCPLHCIWCSNPESRHPYSEVGVNRDSCIGNELCGKCRDVCIQGALMFSGDKIAGIDREKCTNCFACAKVCVNDTLKIFGTDLTVDQLMKIIRADRKYYDQSGGGVTFSGGDPLIQWEFVRDVLAQCKRLNINTCVESELFCKREILDEIIPYTDLFISDIKHMDSGQHRQITNVGNEIILGNLQHLVSKNMPLVLRIPIVTGYNDSEENIRKTGEFIQNELHNRIIQLQLLPFRPLGEDKYESLGISYPMTGTPSNRDLYTDQLTRIAEELQKYGVPAVPGAMKLSEKMRV